MKVGICSDIHVHRHEQAAEIAELVEHINAQQDLDLLICAGDLSHRTAELRAFLRSITVDCPRAWVPGNHDLWVIDAESADDSAERRYRVTFPAISAECGWHYLPAGPLVLNAGAVAVVGSTAWFTGAGFSEWFDEQDDERNDGVALRLAEDLDACIAATDPSSRLIVVTHHVPHLACLPEGTRRTSEHSTHVAEVIARHASRITLVAHGHKHHRYGPRSIEGLRYVAHPFGYPRQHQSVDDGLSVLTLDL